MGPLKTIAIIILVISFFTFIAFFGRLPAFRNTPIGTLHRVLWLHIPGFFRSLDQRWAGGRLSTWMSNSAHTLWNDRHPLVLIFFILLLSVSEILFIPPAWTLMSSFEATAAFCFILLPYIFLYASAASDPGYITPENHVHQMSLYPYDFTVFHPGNSCKTCHQLKPARSKHCSICKHCIAKMDHHCIFINNCVGYRNQHYFLLLLFTTASLTTFASYLGSTLLSRQIRSQVPDWKMWGGSFTWSEYGNIMAWALQENTRIGAVTLLCILTSPLIWGLLGYHIYLIWAGTTTNESLKWGDWQYEMTDGYAFKRKLSPDRIKDPTIEPMWTRWPAESQQVVLHTEDGMPPVGVDAIGVGEWERVWKLKDVENLYDLGFWDNLMDVVKPRYGFRQRHLGQNGQATRSRPSSGTGNDA